jgi:formyltetrahydrofolate deformylase
MAAATAHVAHFLAPTSRGSSLSWPILSTPTGANIVHADQHRDEASGLFLSRLEWQLAGFNLPPDLIGPAFNAIAQPLGATWQLHFSETVPRIAIWVSRQDHCLLDLLWRHRAREFHAEIPLIISNHPPPGGDCPAV